MAPLPRRWLGRETGHIRAGDGTPAARTLGRLAFEPAVREPTTSDDTGWSLVVTACPVRAAEALREIVERLAGGPGFDAYAVAAWAEETLPAEVVDRLPHARPRRREHE